MTRRPRRAHKRTPGNADPFARKRRAAARQRDTRRDPDRVVRIQTTARTFSELLADTYTYAPEGTL